MGSPTKVRINSVDWVIAEVTARDLWHESEGKDLLGQCVYEDGVINLRAEMNDQRKAQVLWHEVLHAVDGDAQLNLSEQQIASMANGLLSALRDNPALVAYLLTDPATETPPETGNVTVTKGETTTIYNISNGVPH